MLSPRRDSQRFLSKVLSRPLAELVFVVVISVKCLCFLSLFIMIFFYFYHSFANEANYKFNDPAS